MPPWLYGAQVENSVCGRGFSRHEPGRPAQSVLYCARSLSALFAHASVVTGESPSPCGQRAKEHGYLVAAHAVWQPLRRSVLFIAPPGLNVVKPKRGVMPMWVLAHIPPLRGLSFCGYPIPPCGVEMWRGEFRELPFPHPALQTGRAVFPHPASGQGAQVFAHGRFCLRFDL